VVENRKLPVRANTYTTFILCKECLIYLGAGTSKFRCRLQAEATGVVGATLALALARSGAGTGRYNAGVHRRNTILL